METKYVSSSYEADESVKKSLLSDRAILEHINRGSVVIFPFEKSNLSTSRYSKFHRSYDCTI
jgi:hypothetical protein